MPGEGIAGRSVSTSVPIVSPSAASVRLLDQLRAADVLCRRVHLAHGWQLRIDVCALPRVYVVTSGAVRFETSAGTTWTAEAGDVVFLPSGVPHGVSTAKRTSRVLLSSLVPTLRADRTAPLRVGAGAVGAELIVCLIDPTDGARPWLAMLPQVLRIRGAEPAAVEVRELLVRCATPDGGSAAARSTVRRRLAEACMVIAATAALLPNTAAPATLASALGDERLAPAALAVLERPGEAWRLPGLAAVAGLSRAAFAARFKRVTGTTPHGFVTAVRVAAARELLTTREHKFAAVAARVGYRDASALRRALRRTEHAVARAQSA